MKHFKNILYIAEPERDQTAALARAVSLAENNQARLTLLQVIEPPRAGVLDESRTLEALFAQARRRITDNLTTLAAPYRDRVVIAVEVRLGHPYLEIIRDVLAAGRDLVVKLTSPEVGFIDRFLGGTDLQLLRKCPCPVWILSPQDKDNYRRILAAVDFDPWREDDETLALNRQILGLASSLALSDFADLHLVHSWEPLSPEMMRLWSDDEDAGAIADQVTIEHLRHQETFERLARHLRDWIGAEAYDYLTPRLHLLEGSALETIPHLAARMKFDLVVMGTVGRAGIPGAIIGNTAESILGQLRCALLAVKPADFVTPVTLPD
jgi:nucleotide-binding universal stress UspA family protein